MGTVPGDSIQIAREYMDSLLVESRIIGAVRPTARFDFLGEHFDTPIMTAALSHIDLCGMAEGAKQAGAPVSIGMGDNETLGDVLKTGAKVMKIIKPYTDPEEIYSRIRFAEENGAIAVGMDVEHSIHSNDPEADNIHGLQMKLPTMEGFGLFVTQVCRDCGIPYNHGRGTMTYSACFLLE